MITEYAPGTEKVTAVLTSHLESGENFEGAITIGIYPNVDSEIWMQAGGGRINIQLADLSDFIKQLKRAGKLAAESGSTT